nr:beta-lactamase family protein [Rikenella sp.]
MAKNFLTLFLLPLLAVSCLSEDEIKQPFRSFVPEPAADGWTIAAPEAEGMDAEALRAVYEDFHADREAWQVRSLLVVRNGKLVAESYTKDPADRDRLHPVWSCTKQVLALLVQQAVEQGVLDEDLNRPIARYLPELLQAYPDKADITLENLLTMTSGIAFSNSGFNGGANRLLKQIPDRSTEFVLGLPVAGVPGEQFNYSAGVPQLVSAILQARLGRPVDEWADEVMIEPLGRERWEGLRYRDGMP